jgi:hypothetical protein
MDSHDPDEASASGPLGHSDPTTEHSDHAIPHTNSHEEELLHSSRVWNNQAGGQSHPQISSPLPYTSFPFSNHNLPEPGDGPQEFSTNLLQPRPTSSSSSSSDSTVDKLESQAAKLDRPIELEHIGIKQHISTSIKSLFRLARVAGMERVEFERLVRTELDVLGLLEEDD